MDEKKYKTKKIFILCTVKCKINRHSLVKTAYLKIALYVR